MNLSAVIAGYAAVVSTIAAGVQVANWRRDRPVVALSISMRFSPLDESTADTALGTPIRIKRGRDLLTEQASVLLTVRNSGRQALQIVGVVIESIGDEFVSIIEVVPPPLPYVVEPSTSIGIVFQKEFLDECSAVSFVGVVDALGRRHTPPASEVVALVEQSWALPTRVATYRRRDDPTEVVKAFQSRHTANLSQRKTSDRRKCPKVMVRRELA